MVKNKCKNGGIKVLIVGMTCTKEDAEEVLYVAKLVVVGNRARELSREARQIDYFVDDTINMYQPKGGEK